MSQIAPVGKQESGAQEDGDFVALRASRANRVEEEFSIPEEDLREIRELTSPPPNYVSKESPGSKPELNRPRSAANRKRNANQSTPWEQLSDAACSNLDKFKRVINELRSYSLTSSKLRDPEDNSNILHFTLEFGTDEQIIDYVIDISDQELIQQEFDVTVSKITGKKNALHQVVERGNLKRLKQLINKLSQKSKQRCLIAETRVEIIGQRPRTFTCLHLAAFYGFTEIAVFLLEAGVEINHLNAKKDTALLWASRWGHTECVKTFLQRGARPDVENDKGSTALYWAVRYGHLDTVKLLVGEGKANVNQTRKLGLVAPIVLACALGFEEIAVVLLDHGAHHSIKIRAGERPIHHAAREGYSNIIQMLLKRGAAIDYPDNRGDTALLLAARHGHAKAMYTLLTHGASVNVKNLMGESVWDIAASNEVDLIIKILVTHQMKEPTPTTDIYRDTPQGVNALIFLAASFGNLSRLKLLFNMGIDAGVTDEHRNNFLHYAARKGQAAVIKEFHKKVNLDGANDFGNTPLHEACSMGQHEAITELINVKAMANIKNKKGETALHVAAFSTTIQPMSVSSLMDYVIRTHPYECLNIKDDEGNSCLHIAAKFAKPEVLWEFRFVRFKDADVDGNLPLHESVRKGEPECLDTMLDIYDAMKRDCDINHQNHRMETALILASREGFIEGVKRLLLYGADISKAESSGNTVMHEMTRLVVDDPVHRHIYLEVIHVILKHASVWYGEKNQITIHETDRDTLYNIKRQGVLSLVREIPNEAGLSVMDYACKLGAAPVVHVLTNMKDVTMFKMDKYVRYDITQFTPLTNESIARRNSSVSPKGSCLEWLLSMDNPQGAATVLDVQPFSDIERAYSSVAAWAYAIIMIFHIVYMTVATVTGVQLLDDARKDNTDSERDRMEIVLYVIVPIEPALIILYNAYSFIKLCCNGRFSTLNKSGIFQLFYESIHVWLYLTYAIFVILWIVFYSNDYKHKDYFLSVALLIGWLISISFTRGFKVIHYFWRMIQNMILKDIFKFMVIYLFVLLAFSFAMHVAIQFSSYLSGKFPNPAHTMFMVFNLMVGMTELFDGELGQGTDSSKNTLYLKIVYVVYIILATIVLLNLLIAMMNDSYQAIQQKQSLSWRIESVQLGVDVEKMLPATFRMFSKVKVSKGYITPMDMDRQVKRWFIEVPVSTSTYHGLTDTEEEKQVLADIQNSINNMETKMTEQVHSLKSNMDNMQSVLKGIEATLEKLNKT